MKRLIIIRHAKSSWENNLLSDADRPLNTRGIKAAKAMGAFVEQKKLSNILLLSSPANRAFSTASIIASVLNHQDPILIRKELYTFSDIGKVFIDAIKAKHNNAETIIIFGHNETCYEFVSNLSKGTITKFPTCAAVSFLFSEADWEHISEEKLSMEWCQFPKDL